MGHGLLEELHSLDRREVGEVVAQHDATRQQVGLDEEVVTTCAGGIKVDGGVDSFVGETTVKLQLHIAGTLKLLKDNVIHLAARLGEGGGNDGEATAILYLARGTEEALGLLKGVGFDTSTENLAAGRLHSIVGTCQTGDTIKDDDNVVSTFGETLGLLKDDVGDTNMTVGRLVEGGGDDLSLHAALHVGDLLGTLVDKEHHKVDLRMVEGNGIGHLLEEGGLTGLRLCHNKTTLTFSYRGKKINDTRGKSLLRMTRELEFLIGEKRREALKRNAVANTVGSEAIDAEQLDKDEELVGLTGRTHHAANLSIINH